MYDLKILIGGILIFDAKQSNTQIESLTITKDVKTNESIFILSSKSTNLVSQLIPDHIISEIKTRTENFNPQSVEIIAGEMGVYGKLRNIECTKSTIQGLPGLYDRVMLYYYDEVGK